MGRIYKLLLSIHKSIRSQGLAVILSLVALAVSIRTCYISERAASIAEGEHIQQRSIVLKGTIDNTAATIQLEPTSDELTLLEAKAYFPPNLMSSAPIGMTSDFKLNLNALRLRLYSFVLDKKNRIFPGRVPVIIYSTYVAKNERYSDTSVYELDYAYYSSNKEHHWERLRFEGLYFFAHLKSLTKNQILESLTKLWQGAIDETNELSEDETSETL